MIEYVSKKIFVVILKVAIYIYESIKVFCNYTFHDIDPICAKGQQPNSTWGVGIFVSVSD